MSWPGSAYWRFVAAVDGCRSARFLLDRFWDWTHSRERFVVVSCERNAGRDALTCLQSVYEQDYPRCLLRHVFIDDASTDETEALVRGWLATHRNHRVEFIRNESQQGGTANTLKAVRMAQPGEIVLEVNGDDWLADGGVVRYLNRVFHNPDVWMTYNSFRYVDNRSHNLCVPIPESVIRCNTHREHEEFFGRHLHAFRKELFDHVDPSVMIDPATGQHWASADDQALYLCMFELAGQHVRHIDRTLYIYNLRPYSHEVWEAKDSVERVARIRKMTPFTPLKSLAGHTDSPTEFTRAGGEGEHLSRVCGNRC